MVRAILVNATDLIGHHGCTLVNQQIEILARAAGIELVGRLPLHSNWSKYEARNFDCIIVNGEGTLHSSSKGAKKIAEVPNWAKSLKVPCFLINTIYQNNSEEIFSSIKKFDGVWVRDEKSRQNLDDFGLKVNAIPDLSLSWMPNINYSKNKYIVIQDSSIDSVKYDLYNFSKDIKAEYISLMARPSKFIDYSNLYKRGKFLIRKNLYWLILDQEKRNRYKNVISDFDDFIKIMKDASLIMTGRFHGVALALDLKIPFIALSANSHKIESLLDSVAMQYRLAENIDDVKSILNCQKIMNFSDDEIRSIEGLQNRTYLEGSKMFIQIAQFVKSQQSEYSASLQLPSQL
ncbi:MAG: polysaccharide pyruvyl transferase family protein [Rhodomicrobium sp.]|nr:polysaccharide pyruvyl transferase family protein [Rhodomicrobium sp.]